MKGRQRVLQSVCALAVTLLFLMVMIPALAKATPVLTIGASGTPTYLGLVTVVASGSVQCTITSIGTNWASIGTNQWIWFVHFADYSGINFRGYFSLNAPGWSDSAYATMSVYHWNSGTGTFDLVITNYDGTDSYWNGNMYVPGDQSYGGYYAIGTPQWKIVWEAKGYDWGNLSCLNQQTYFIYNK